jgi:hypothetical protein
LQTPEAQAEPVVQVAPGGKPGVQRPDTQASELHSPPLAQGEPAGFPSHVPFVHSPDAQTAPVVHAPPGGKPTHRPFTQRLEAQSLFSRHGVLAGGWHTPFAQMPELHWPLTVQGLVGMEQIVGGTTVPPSGRGHGPMGSPWSR